MQTQLHLKKAIAHMRHLAECLIAHDAKEHKSSGTPTPATFPVSEKLQAPLAALVGNTGFATLLSRALVLSRADVAWLATVHVKADGSLDGLAGLEAQVNPEKILEGRVVLLTKLLELLEAFIGENLTMQIVRDIWPQLLPNNSDVGD
jgi:hypothetical protein